jgi:hypothetical protein
LTAPEIAALKAKEEAEGKAGARSEVGPGGESVSGTSPSDGDGVDESNAVNGMKVQGKPMPGHVAAAQTGGIDMDWSWAG